MQSGMALYPRGHRVSVRLMPIRRYFPLGNGCLRCRIPVNTVSRLFSYDISTLLIPVFLHLELLHFYASASLDWPKA